MERYAYYVEFFRNLIYLASKRMDFDGLDNLVGNRSDYLYHWNYEIKEAHILAYGRKLIDLKKKK